ncbi:MAG: hypothetical protein SPI30_08245 [Prevotella sp.]|nr:hypothetical protein [Prevotella sp.]
MPIVPTIGSHSTSRWYGCYQCLVRTLPIIGSDRTAVQHECHSMFLMGAMGFQSKLVISPSILHSSLMTLLLGCFRSFVDIFSAVFFGVACYAFCKSERRVMFRTDTGSVPTAATATITTQQ